MPRTQVLADSSASRRDSSHSPPFACSWTNSGPDSAWVHLAGPLEFSTVSQLARALRELGAGARLIVLDLRELELIDYFGIHAIANASAKARELGHRLVVLRGAQDIDRMFMLAGRLAEVEIDDLESGVPRAQALLRLAPQ